MADDTSQVRVPAVWTIGHSTLAFDDFAALLRTHRIEAILDVRRFPGSRRYPWFAREVLVESLPGRGIGYAWLPQLGGRRKARAGSTNTGWRNASFQGYADHLESAEFAEGLAAALDVAEQRRSALMCAESLWWRCHRGLVSDVLKLRGTEVWHILGDGAPTLHPWTPPARVVDGRLCYPPAQPSLFEGDDDR